MSGQYFDEIRCFIKLIVGFIVADLMDPPPPYSHGQNVTTSSPQSGYHQQYRSYHSITRSSPRSEHYHQYSSRYIVTTSAGSGHHAHDQYGHSSSHEGTSLLRPTSNKPFHIATKNLFILISAFVVLLLVFTAQNTGYLPTMVDEVPAEVKRQSYQRWQRELDEHKVEVGTRLAQLVELEQERWEAMQEFEEQRKAYERERERWAEERRRWAEERRRWEQERQEEERHRKEVERRRQGVHWSGPWKNGGCVAYGVQSYSANLLDIPQDLNWREVCEDMPIQIEGRWYDRPNKCEANVSMDFGLRQALVGNCRY